MVDSLKLPPGQTLFPPQTITIDQKNEQADPQITDIVFNITEGNQTFVDRVLVSGLHYTRESTIQPHILLHPGDPLDQSALFDMQRQMYDLTLFNEVGDPPFGLFYVSPVPVYMEQPYLARIGGDPGQRFPFTIPAPGATGIWGQYLPISTAPTNPDRQWRVRNRAGAWH